MQASRSTGLRCAGEGRAVVLPYGAGRSHVEPGSRQGGQDLAGRPHLATCRSVPHSGARPGPPSAAHSRTSVVVTEAVLRAAPSRGAGPRADGQLAAWAVGGPVFGVWGALLVRARARRGAADAGTPPPPALGRCSSGHWAASQSETGPCGSSKGPPASSVPSASSKSSQSEGATWSPAGFLGCGATACCNLITG